MRARRCALLLAVCAVAGCGGSDKKAPTAAEIEAAQQRRLAAVDEVCFEVNRAFGERGRPAEVATLGRTVADGVAEVRELVPDAVRSPIFLKRLRRHDRRFVRRLPEYDEPATTSTELAERMEGLRELVDFAVADAATFDPPSDAAKATGVYRASARRLLSVVRRFEASARGGTTASSPGLRRHQPRSGVRGARRAAPRRGCGRAPACRPPATTPTPTTRTPSRAS